MTDAGWQVFKTRILDPMEAGVLPDVSGLSKAGSVDGLLDGEIAFVCGADTLIQRQYTGRDGLIYESGRIALKDGTASLDAARNWAATAVKAKRYRRSRGRNGRVALQSTGWRKPVLELYFNPETARECASLVAWETEVAHDDLAQVAVQRPMTEAAHVG